LKLLIQGSFFFLIPFVRYLRTMRIFLSLLLASILTSFIAPLENKVTHRLIVHPSSTATINGKTSVNKYQCAIGQYSGSDTLVITGAKGNGVVFEKGLVLLKATEFECDMKVITKDFVEMIQAEKYPYIKIEFTSFGRAPKFETAEEKFKGNLKITLGDVSVPCEVKCNIVKGEKNLFHLRGKRQFKFSDFNLQPPSKMMGLVKVNEDIEVSFHLVLSLQ
jgi:hypothetical protein